MSIFQKSVIQKYIKSLNPERVEKAFNKFNEIYNPAKKEEIKKLKEEEYQDGFLRDIFVNVFGYTLKPDDGHNLVREYKNQTDGKKVDGAIMKEDNAIAVIELKSTKTKDLTSITQQAFNYKNNQPGCKYVITSNFQKLRFYIDYSNEFEEFDLFNLQKHRFDLLYLILNKDRLLVDTPLKLKSETRFHEEKVSDQLYKDYSEFKQKIFNNLLKNNPETEKLTLFKKSQKLLDRLLFIFFAEDCQLLPANSISRIIDRFEQLKELDAYKPLYEIYKQYFGYMNIGRKGKTSSDDIPAYNGGLFAPDEILDNIKIDDEILKADSLKLSAYDFNTEVDVNILGHIFENSLNEIEDVEKSLQEPDNGSKPKTSKRKKDGVFYTPKYITQYIVENTIGTLCTEKRKELQIIEIEFDDTYRTKAGNLAAKGKKLYDTLQEYKKWLLSLKIIDPACGSGAFLNQALIFLIQEHKLIDGLISELTGDALGLFDTDKAILENNIYGVDINEESVEIAKLSLWLHTAQKGRKLSDLSGNIKCGNSLIDDPSVAGDKAFDWNVEFKDIMNNGGFDVVIGNPPYVNVELMPKKDKIFFKNKFSTFYKRGDLFSLFLDLATDSISSKGNISFIIPSVFLNNLSYKLIRERLLENNWLSEICYTGNSVFKDATVDTVILVISKLKNKSGYIKLVNALNFNNPSVNHVSLDYFERYDNNISIGGEKSNSISDKVFANNNIEIQNNFKVFQGIVTGNNDAFIFENEKDALEKEIEQELLFTLCHGRDISKWFVNNDCRRILYTNSDININEFNGAFSWLSAFKNKLGERRECKKGIIPWYSLQWPRIKSELDVFPKIAIQNTRNERLQPRIVATLDTFGFYSSQGLNFIIPENKNISVYFLISILNSKLINYIFSTKFLNLAIKAEYLKKLKYPQILEEAQQPFIKKADLMLSLNKELQNKSDKFIKRIKSNLEVEKITGKLQNFYNYDFKTFITELKKQKIKLSLTQQDEWEDYFDEKKQEINQLQTQISQTDIEIDKMVYELYELTEEEISIVENS